MQRFIHAVNSTESPQYYLPKELTSAVCGRRIRIVGGALDGYEGRLLTIRGVARETHPCRIADLDCCSHRN